MYKQYYKLDILNINDTINKLSKKQTVTKCNCNCDHYFNSKSLHAGIIGTNDEKIERIFKYY